MPRPGPPARTDCVCCSQNMCLQYGHVYPLTSAFAPIFEYVNTYALFTNPGLGLRIVEPATAVCNYWLSAVCRVPCKIKSHIKKTVQLIMWIIYYFLPPPFVDSVISTLFSTVLSRDVHYVTNLFLLQEWIQRCLVPLDNEHGNRRR